jgi:hypothetical protein
MKSKRSALRLACSDHLVSYKTTYEEGQARLVNISTDGCAFEQPTVVLSINEKILISVALPGDENAFEAQGVVVRVNDQCTAIRFTLVEQKDQAEVRRYFTTIMRKE